MKRVRDALFGQPIWYGSIDIRRRLRKFAAFESQAREFLYIDLDSIVLAPFDRRIRAQAAATAAPAPIVLAAAEHRIEQRAA